MLAIRRNFTCYQATQKVLVMDLHQPTPLLNSLLDSFNAKFLSATRRQPYILHGYERSRDMHDRYLEYVTATPKDTT